MKKIIVLIFVTAALLSFVSCGDYGTRLMFDNTELYYTEDVKESEAKAIGEYLQEIEFTNPEAEIVTVQIAKDGDVYQFRLVVKDGFEKDKEYEEIAKVFLSLLSEYVLDGAKVEFHMCDTELETLKVVKMD